MSGVPRSGCSYEVLATGTKGLPANAQGDGSLEVGRKQARAAAVNGDTAPEAGFCQGPRMGLRTSEPWRRNDPFIMAVRASPGMPRESMVVMAPPVQALFVDSGASLDCL